MGYFCSVFRFLVKKMPPYGTFRRLLVSFGRHNSMIRRQNSTIEIQICCLVYMAVLHSCIINELLIQKEDNELEKQIWCVGGATRWTDCWRCYGSHGINPKPRGGYRPGAGRKAIHGKTRTFRVPESFPIWISRMDRGIVSPLSVKNDIFLLYF